jgi:hypothetical protein
MLSDGRCKLFGCESSSTSLSAVGRHGNHLVRNEAVIVMAFRNFMQPTQNGWRLHSLYFIVCDHYRFGPI